jgi:uncharacterized protein with HEPN domain
MSAEKRWQIRIEHFMEAIAKIQQYSGGLTQEAFTANSMAVDAVIRNFQVMGEAVRHVPKHIQDRYPEVPWSLVQGMRHILVHDYFAVKLDIVWRTVQDSLPPLLEPLQRILQENP